MPSADAAASVSAFVVSVTAPPAESTTPEPTVEVEMVLTMLMPTAAATLTPPSSVWAFGVLSESPSPLPPLSCDSPSAKPRCPLTWLVTPLVLESEGVALGDESWGPPAADA